MTATEKKAPKKGKEKRQSPEERLEALRYNHMMYGPTPGEFRPAPKKINYGVSYLKHPKFLALMTAFKNGSDYKFTVSDKSKTFTISTDGSQILFDGKVVYYCRPLNKFEHSLLMDRTAAIQYQANEAFIHLVFAVLKHFPELGTTQITYLNNEFYFGTETFEIGVAMQGPNLMIGSYKLHKGPEKNRK
jgi:hypothetical protein